MVALKNWIQAEESDDTLLCSRSGATHPRAKNRVGDFFSHSLDSAGQTTTQVVECDWELTFCLYDPPRSVSLNQSEEDELGRYQSMAEELGWTGFETELSERQQLYYGKIASKLLRLEGEGIDVSQQWEAVLREVPYVIVDSAGLVASGNAEAARNEFLSGRYNVALASYGVVGVVITGYTFHGLHQAIGRDGVGVSPRAMLDAIRNPLSITKRSGGITQYKGRHAVVRMNAHGQVVTTWARGKAGFRIPRFGSTHRK